MGFVFIRHSAVELSWVDMDHVQRPLVCGEIFGKIREAGERELVLVDSPVAAGNGTQRCAILSHV